MKNVLIIAPHPDDETLGVGGSILKHKENGDKVFWTIVTERKGNFDYKDKCYCESNIPENERNGLISRVREAYKFDDVFEFKCPDLHLDKIAIAEIISKIQELVQKLKPEIIYIPFYNDIHTDHQIVFNAAISACKNFRTPFIKRILMYEIPSSTDFAIVNQFVPNVFVNIGNYIDKKLEIYSYYKSEIMKSPYPRAFDSIRAYDRVRGARCGCRYAEAFQLIFEKVD